MNKGTKGRMPGMMPNAECYRCGDFVFANLDQPGELTSSRYNERTHASVANISQTVF